MLSGSGFNLVLLTQVPSYFNNYKLYFEGGVSV